MRAFFAYSFAAHGILIAGFLILGTLLSKPRMSYYSIDLFSATPSGPVGGASAAPVTAVNPAEAPPVMEAEKPVSNKDVIRVRGKVKKRPVPVLKPKAPVTPKPLGLPSWAQSSEGGTASQGGVSSGGAGISGKGGSGLVAEAGANFPFPWYLRQVSDRLDQQWHPPEEYPEASACQVTFTISQDGSISKAKITKPSGDQLFDQLALRAVLYSNPVPPLPNGFPDSTLRVHMKFVGRNQ